MKRRTLLWISLLLVFSSLNGMAQPSHTNLLYSHFLDNSSAPQFSGFQNNGGTFLTGQGWRADTQNSQLMITLPSGLPWEGTFVVDVTNFNPITQNVLGKQQIINLYSQSNGSKDIFDTDGSWTNIRTGTNYSTGPGKAGFKFLAAPKGGVTREEARIMESYSGWNTSATYEFKIVWNTQYIWVFLDGVQKAEFNFSGQIEPFRYIFIGTDNVYVGQPGVIYKNMRIYGPGQSSSITFTDITTSSNTSGYSDVGYHHGAAFSDVNGDGLYDLFVSNAAGVQSDPDLLYVNQGSIIFSEQAGARGTSDIGSTHTILSADIDNDSDMDALFSNMPIDGNWSLAQNNLYANDGTGNFTNISGTSGLTQQSGSRSALALDIEGDGDLDIYSVNWGAQNELFLNDGTGNFTQVTRGAEGPVGDTSAKQGVTAGDVDGDGDIDIYVSRREATNWLFINDGSGNFTEQASTRGVAVGGRTHGSTFADIDNDGDLDLFVANFGYPGQPLPLLGVFINNGTGQFTDLTNVYNIQVSAYTAAFGDVDNDADLDLYLVRNDEKDPGTRLKLYLNDGSGGLSPASVPGLEIAALDARTAVYADIENDGDIDWFVTCADGWNYMLRNDTNNSNNYIQVLCTGPGGDFGGFGSKVFVYEPGYLGNNNRLLGFQEPVSNFGYLGQHQTALHFGLASFNACDIRIIQTDGSVLDFTNVAANQLFQMQPGDPNIITTTCPSVMVGEAYSTNISVTGGVIPYYWAVVSGSLPTGLTLNNATGEIYGTPTVVGTSNFTVEVRDSQSPQATDTQALSIEITPLPPLQITTTGLPSGVIGDAYSRFIAVEGGLAPYFWSVVSGALPPGLALDSVTGEIYGAPTLTGTFDFTIQVQDSQSPQATTTQAYSVTVNDAPTIDEEFTTNDYFGYTQYIPVSGATMSMTERADWLRIQCPNTTKYDHWYDKDQAPQLRRAVDTGDWQITTRCELISTSGSKFHTGLMVYFSQYDVYYWGFCGNNSTLIFSRTGDHPLGTATYTGGPVVDLRIRKVGNIYYFEYKTPASSSWSSAGQHNSTTTPVDVGLIAKTWNNITLVTDYDYLRLGGDELAITTASLKDGQVGSAYNDQVQAQGGIQPYTWSISSGSLPVGLNINTSTGQITGSPGGEGTWNFTVQVIDSDNPQATVTRDYSISINPVPPLEITTSTLSSGVVGVAYNGGVQAQGGTTPYAWDLSAGSLPTGLSLGTTTGQITGTPLTEGTFNFTVRVTDSQFQEDTQAFSITIMTQPTLDPEFMTGSLAGYTVHIPAAGPSVNATDRQHWCRFDLPSTTKYDHWKTVDNAPQLRRNVGSGDWELTTRCELIMNSGSKFHTGLLVYFSTFDVFYWGFCGSSNQLVFSRTGDHGLATVNYNGGLIVDLRIRKVGTTYYFEYKNPSGTQWTTAATRSTATSAVEIGLIAKTWGSVDMIADYDYLRLSGDGLSVSTETLANGLVGASYTAQLEAQGGTTPYTWSLIDGQLPGGLILNGSTGQISGTPGTQGTFNFTVKVTDSDSPAKTATKALSIQITQITSPEITTTALPGGTVGVGYNSTVQVQGGLAPYAWSISAGTLPPGLSIDPVTGQISGTSSLAGTYNFTVQVTDSQSPSQSDTQAFTVVISTQPTLDEEFVTGSLAGYTLDLPLAGPDVNATERAGWCRFDLPSTSAFDHWSNKDNAPQLRRNLPSGDWQIQTRCELINASGGKFQTGLLVHFSRYDLLYWGFDGSAASIKLTRSGTHDIGIITTNYAGGNVVDLRIRKIGTTYFFDYKSPAASQWTTAGQYTEATVPGEFGLIAKTWAAINLTSDFDYLRLGGDQLVIITTTMPGGQTGVAYNAQLEAQGGTTPYLWALIGGQLPGGLVLNGTTGQITGTPVAEGTFNFSVRVTDSSNPDQTTTKDLSIQINPLGPPQITTTSLPGGTTGVSYNTAVQAQGGITPYTWAISAGSLPPGLALNTSTGQISGTPTLVGTFNFTVQVTDSQNPQQSDTQALSIVVSAQPTLDEEFVTGSLAGYTLYTPVNGPNVNATDRSGWCRFDLPATTVYDHWSSKDRAPQLRRALPSGDWQIQTRCELINATGSKFQTGLMVYFSRYDLLYWGFDCSSGSIKLTRSGTEQIGIISQNYTGGNIVDLRIRKAGSTYYFDYKTPTSSQWTEAGQLAIGTVPSDFGLIAKTWVQMDLMADFDYLRLGGDQLSMITTSLPDGQQGLAYNSPLEAQGGTTPYSWALTGGQLPGGLVLNGQTGQISGTPTNIGTFNFSVRVTDSSNPAQTATQNLSIEINPVGAPQITTTGLPDGTTGVAYSTAVQASGGITPYTWAISAGTLPPGLALNTTSGLVSGTPTLVGTFNFTVQVTDSQNPQQSDTQALSINVTAQPALDEEFVTGSLAGHTLYIPFAGPNVNATDRQGWCRFDLPNDMAYDHWSSKDRAPQLRRDLIPEDWQIETRCEIITAPGTKFQTGLLVYFSRYDLFYWGFDGSTSSIKLTRSGTQEIGIFDVNYAGGSIVDLQIRKVGNTYYFDYKIPASSQWTTAGQQTVAATSTEFGLIAKTWENVNLISDFDYLRLHGDELRIKTSSLASGQVGTPYSDQLSAEGGTAPYSWALASGQLPGGLVLNGQNGSIAGTPTTEGTFNFTIQVTDSETPAETVNQVFSIDIGPVANLEITTTSMPFAFLGETYDNSIAAQGGIVPYNWSISSGGLPPGLALNATTGDITGTPTTEGTYNFTARVTDSQSPADEATANLSIQVSVRPAIDEEFITGSLDNYTVYLPVAGPTIDATSHPDFLQMSIPRNGTYDHWAKHDSILGSYTIDKAPQLRRTLTGQDFSLETKVKVLNYDNLNFMTGLQTFFSSFDLFYWGFGDGINQLILSRTRKANLIVEPYNGGNEVELRLRKEGEFNYVEYRQPGHPNWTDVLQQPTDHTTLVYSHPLDNASAPQFDLFENRDGTFLPGEGWKAVANSSRLKIALPQGMPREGTMIVDVTNFDPVSQNTLPKHQIINFYSHPSGDKWSWWNGGSYFNIRSGTEYADDPGAGFAFIATPDSVFRRNKVNVLRGATWDLNHTYEFKFVWTEERMFFFVDEMLQGVFDFTEQNGLFRYIFLGTDNVYNAQPGPIYSNLRLYEPAGTRSPAVPLDIVSPRSTTQITAPAAYPMDVGIITKSYDWMNLLVEFDYLRLDETIMPRQISNIEETAAFSDDLFVELNVPETFSLSQNYPNPFNPTTKVDMQLPEAENVTAVVYNIMGQLVTTLYDGFMEAGEHEFVWNSTDDFGSLVQSGIYFMRLRVGDEMFTRKMLLVK